MLQRATLRAVHALPAGRVFYRVPWWGDNGRGRFQGRLSIAKDGALTRAHWLAFSPKDFRPIVDKVLVIDDRARIVQFRIGTLRVISNDSGSSLAYERALEFAVFCLELRRRYEV